MTNGNFSNKLHADFYEVADKMIIYVIGVEASVLIGSARSKYCF